MVFFLPGDVDDVGCGVCLFVCLFVCFKTKLSQK